MKQFHYRLEALLRRAEHVEQSLQLELAQWEQERNRALDHLTELALLHKSLQRRLRELQRGDLDLERLAAVRFELDRCVALSDLATRRCAELEARVERTRQLLLEAARSRQGFEKHRDGLALQHRKEALAEEAKQLDDLASRRLPLVGSRSGGGA